MEAREGRSSSNDLSSAPNSDIEAPPSTFQRPTSHLSAPGRTSLNADDSTIIVKGQNGVGGPDALGGASAATASATPANSRQDAPAKVRKPRKKKEPATIEAEKKEKPVRKPRAAAGTAATARKKQKLENTNGDTDTSKACTPSTESKEVAKQSSLAPSLLTWVKAEPHNIEAAKNTQLGMSGKMQEYESPQPPTADTAHTLSPPQAALRTTSVYDPVRSLTIQRPIETSRPPSTPQITHTPPRPAYNPSASPAISGIIDHPPPQNYPTSTPVPAQVQPNSYQLPPAKAVPEKLPSPARETDMSDAAPTGLKRPSPPTKASSEGPSNATSPKPVRAKEQPPPLPQGSGLLSSSLFGGDSKAEDQAQSEKGPSIVLHIDLKGKNNQIINFAKMAEEKYGFAALYPRQAAQRERLARVAAAGAALERSASGSRMGGSAAESGDDDGSVDIDRDSDNDGDVMMSGVNGGQEGANSGTDGAAPKRRRRRKIEEYDQDDPFVDDSEMLWEAQAAASKDGFFVYCGPLVPEGEKPTVERADGTIKRGRGRGRGGGIGSRGGRGAASAGSNADTTISGRAGGPGSRGGTTTRKPRITKAERAMREAEKANREKMAPLAAKPVTFPS